MSNPPTQNSTSKTQNAPVSPARRAAFEILHKIAVDQAFSAILLPAYEENLKPEDRALCHEMVLGILRRQTWLDAHIKYFSGKQIEKLDSAVVLALRIGIYQIKFLTKIPVRAAVNESVNLVYLAKKRSAAGFVNAVLRKIEREISFDPLADIANPLARLSVETSHPLWLLENWQTQFGFDETANLARVNNIAPPTALRVTDFANEQKVLDELTTAGAALTASAITPHAWRITGATQKLRELAAAGKIYVQDEASQLIAHLTALKNDETFLDVCAAPGSKTTAVANSKLEILNKIVAGDFSFARIKILRETIRRYAAGKIAAVQYDAERSLPFAEKSFDCVLLDAPCSGTGTIRHNPEIRWHLTASDITQLAAKQQRILSNAAQTVKSGGRIIYSTCSLESAEGENVIAQFLAQNNDFIQDAVELPETFVRSGAAVRTLPQRDDTDGFFVTVLRRLK